MSRGYLPGARVLVPRVIGVVLMLAGLGLVATTELQEMEPAAPPALSVVRVFGSPQVPTPVRDAEFNLAVATPVLTRHVAMFQWHEVRLDGPLHYEMDWIDHAVDSARFVRRRDHHNPAFPVRARQFQAVEVRVGGHSLGPDVLHAIPGEVEVEPAVSQLPPNLAASFTVDGNRLVTSADPAHPRLGDVRVGWTAVPLQPITVLAALDGDRLVPSTELPGAGFDVRVGEVALGDLAPVARPHPRRTTVRRVLAVVLAALGAFLCLLASTPSRPDGWLALAVGTAMVGAVACVMWLGNGWVPLLCWLLVAVVASAATVWRIRTPKAEQLPE